MAFPLELYGEDGDPEIVIRELRAVFQFLHREYALPNALECLVALDDGMIAKLREDVRTTTQEIEAEAALLPDELPLLDATETPTDLDVTDDELAGLAFAVADVDKMPRLPSYEQHVPEKRSPRTKAKSKRKVVDASRKKNRKNR